MDQEEEDRKRKELDKKRRVELAAKKEQERKAKAARARKPDTTQQEMGSNSAKKCRMGINNKITGNGSLRTRLFKSPTKTATPPHTPARGLTSPGCATTPDNQRAARRMRAIAGAATTPGVYYNQHINQLTVKLRPDLNEQERDELIDKIKKLVGE